MSEWISVDDRAPPTDEPIVYAVDRGRGKFHVGIAYWTISKKWKPEMESVKNKNGFTHWMPLPKPPKD